MVVAIWSIGSHTMGDIHSGMSFVFVVVGVAMLCLGFVLAFLGITPAPFVITNTRYGPGYSEKRFREIKIGTPAQEVRKTLGPPLAEWTNYNDQVTLRYSFSGHNALYFNMRIVVVSNNVVAQKLAYVWD